MHRIALIAFVSSSCPYCVSLKPELQAIANNRQDVLVTSVDGGMDRKAVNEWGVKNFPTLFFCRVKPMGAPAEILGQQVGFMNAQQLSERINALLPTA